MRSFVVGSALLFSVWASFGLAQEKRAYELKLTKIKDPKPILADHPEWVAPVETKHRYEAPPVIVDDGADLTVRSWRFSYNARAVVEMDNFLKASETALIVVHPWGIDDGQGWKTPQPHGVCDMGTLEKNELSSGHTKTIVAPFVKKMRPRMASVVFSLFGDIDPIREKRYRTLDGKPTAQEAAAADKEMKARLAKFNYEAEGLPKTIELSKDRPLADFFKQFPGVDASARYNGEGFWKLPVPVTADLPVEENDLVLFDAQGYDRLRDFLKKQGVRHVLLTGYACDMCFKATTAGYDNLNKDFNVFLVGDATLSTFPSNDSPKHATNASLSYAALQNMITQTTWIDLKDPK